MRPEGPRPSIVGPASGPEPPFPLRLSGPVIAGFGRGSKEHQQQQQQQRPRPADPNGEKTAMLTARQLGIPTANIPVEGLGVGGCEDISSGIYYGWAGLGGTPASEAAQPAAAAAADDDDDPRPAVYPMVMSIGWNPYYKNTVRSVEVHILRTFPAAFYGAQLRLLVLGFIRPEYDYVSKEGLVEDIRTDVDVARRCLEREPYGRFAGEPWLVEGL